MAAFQEAEYKIFLLFKYGQQAKYYVTKTKYVNSFYTERKIHVQGQGKYKVSTRYVQGMYKVCTGYHNWRIKAS